MNKEVPYMELIDVRDKRFTRYGQLLAGYDFEELLQTLAATTPQPEDHFIYTASHPGLEALPVAAALQNRGYGGMPIQIGYCNGANHSLNCLEYHRDSELLVPTEDIILLLGCQADLQDYRLDTARVEAFLLPAGTGAELFATTLHYAPCCAPGRAGYRVINVLPRGTNAEKPQGLTDTGEDRLCMGRNKWLIAHPQAPEARAGAFVGLYGPNITL